MILSLSGYIYELSPGLLLHCSLCMNTLKCKLNVCCTRVNEFEGPSWYLRGPYLDYFYLFERKRFVLRYMNMFKLKSQIFWIFSSSNYSLQLNIILAHVFSFIYMYFSDFCSSCKFQCLRNFDYSSLPFLTCYYLWAYILKVLKSALDLLTIETWAKITD